jgi:hypothetical protein
MTKTQYKDYLIKYKIDTYPNAQIAAEDYAETWLEFIEKDLDDIQSGRITVMSFKNAEIDHALLNLDEYGEIPEWYRNRLDAYQTWAKDRGKTLAIGLETVADGIDCHLEMVDNE